jgi:hypothetical protein
MAGFVATLQEGELKETFVFPGTATLDEIFDQVAERKRGKSFYEIAHGARIFSLTISRDQLSEPSDLPWRRKPEDSAEGPEVAPPNPS